MMGSIRHLMLGVAVAALCAATWGAGLVLASPLATSLQQPSGWPTAWTSFEPDPIENGCNLHRNVIESYYAYDSAYLYLRLENVELAGWPDASPQGTARYKWFLDTNGDATLVGGSVVDAEYQIMVEDIALVPDPTPGRDLVGEVTFIDDLANVGFTTRWDSTNPPMYATNAPGSGLWRRAIGSGVPGTGGPQGSMSDPDIGYRVDGVYVDMYVSRALVGDLSSLRLLWSTDPQNTNLDQSPNCDRMDDFHKILLPTPTATSTATSTPTQTPIPGEPSTTPTPAVTPTATPTRVGAFMIGGEPLGDIVPVHEEAAADPKAMRELPLDLAVALVLAVGTTLVAVLLRRS